MSFFVAERASQDRPSENQEKEPVLSFHAEFFNLCAIATPAFPCNHARSRMALQHSDDAELSRHQRFRKAALFGLTGLCFVLISLQASNGSSPSVLKSTQATAGKRDNVLF